MINRGGVGRPGRFRRATPAVLAVAGILVVSGCSARGGSHPRVPERSSEQLAALLTHQTAGAIVRVHVGEAAYDLSISEMTPRTDAGGEPPSCVRDIVGPQYNLNWRAVNGAGDGSKAVHVTIATSDGDVLTVGRSQRSCTKLRNFPLELLAPGTQLALGAGVTGAHRNRLTISVNGATRTVKLWRTCTETDYNASETPQCADDPLTFDPPGVYRVSLRA